MSEKDKKKVSQAKPWNPPGEKDLKCDCPGCPTYKGTGEVQENFCGVNVRSLKIAKEKGCICRSCPVAVRAGSRDEYCCIKATRTQQMFDTLLGGLK
ncbi:MAG: DUF2769 domain-containing protein [Promethearchaeati archaeon SRVP18_Atabeyarchaeia-1]